MAAAATGLQGAEDFGERGLHLSQPRRHAGQRRLHVLQQPDVQSGILQAGAQRCGAAGGGEALLRAQIPHDEISGLLSGLHKHIRSARKTAGAVRRGTARARRGGPCHRHAPRLHLGQRASVSVGTERQNVRAAGVRSGKCQRGDTWERISYWAFRGRHTTN